MSVKIIDAVYVRIKDDHDLVVAFLDWTLTNQVFPIRGTGGYSGRGGYGYLHETKHKPAIDKFFKDYKKNKKKPKT
jgi:hypothetical protein